MHGFKPSDILTLLKADLDSWGSSNAVRAEVSVARDPWNVLEILAESPSGIRVILHWAGDKQLGDWDDAPLVTSKIEVVLAYAMGLGKDPNAELHIAQFNSRPAVLDFVARLRERILSYDFDRDGSNADESEETARYIGCEPVVLPDGTPTHAYRLTFELDHALPEYTVRTA